MSGAPTYLDCRWAAIKLLVNRDIWDMQDQARRALETGERDILVDAFDQLGNIARTANENLKLIEGYEDAQMEEKP